MIHYTGYGRKSNFYEKSILEKFMFFVKKYAEIEWLMQKKPENDVKLGNEWVYYLTFAALYSLRPGGEGENRGTRKGRSAG